MFPFRRCSTRRGRAIVTSGVRKVGLLGFGAIGRSIAAAFAVDPVPGTAFAALCCRPGQLAEAREVLPPSVFVTADVADVIALKPDLVIEAASQAAVREIGPRILKAGIDLHVLSTGALADAATRAALLDAADRSGARIAIPAGALAGFRALLSMRQAGLTAVTYTSTKPPLAWAGTPAEARHDLSRLTEPTVIFSGSAAEAALSFPKNANLAAAVALAGLGFERTLVRLVADPTSEENAGRIEAESVVGRLELTLSGRAASSNPKTSEITGMSVIAALRNGAERIHFV